MLLQIGPFLRAELIDRDEAFYRTFASVAAQGGRLYVDFWDSHFPALYGLYAFVLNHIGGMTALRIVMLATVWSGALLFYLLLRRVAGKGAALVGVAAFALTVTSEQLEGRAVNTEHFIQTFVLASLVVASPATRSRLLAAGAFVGIAALFKQQAILYLAVVAVMVPGNRIPSLALLGVGAAIPISLTLVWAAAHGTLGAMYDAAVVSLFTERVGATGGLHRAHAVWELLGDIFRHAPTIVLGALLGVGLLLERRGSATDSAAEEPVANGGGDEESVPRAGGDEEGRTRYDVVPDLVWIGLGCLAIVLAGRRFPHYAILLVPPALRMALAALDGSRPRLAARSVSWALLAFLCVDAGLDATGTIQSQFGAYRSTARAEDWDEYPAAQYLRARMKPEETLFVWGPRPALYHFTERVPTTPFVVQGSLVAASEMARTLVAALADELRREPPSYIVVTPAPKEFSLDRPELGALRTILESDYRPEHEVDGYAVYRRSLAAADHPVTAVRSSAPEPALPPPSAPGTGPTSEGPSPLRAGTPARD